MILKEIKEVVKVRPSYGYKRVTVLVNRARVLRGLKSLNKKRIYILQPLIVLSLMVWQRLL